MAKQIVGTSIYSTKKMTEAQIFTWIFLSLSDKPSSLQEVVALADAINHAIPSHKELQSALGWLIARGLVKKEGRKYAYTIEGAALRKKCVGSKKSMRQAWTAVEKTFSSMTDGGVSVDDVSEHEVDVAYTGYKKWFWQTYRKLSGKNAK